MKGEKALQIDTELLVNYACGLLVPRKAIDVENALLENERIRREYHGILQLMKDYPNHDAEELLLHMTQKVPHTVNRGSFSKGKPKAVNTIQWLFLAAVIIVIAGIGLYVLYNHTN